MSQLLRALGGTLALAAVGATVASAAPPPLTLTSGHADWGVKQSFRSYIQGPIAHGAIAASDGAVLNPDGTFRFTLVSGSYDLGQHAVTAQFDGTVHFTGHDSGAGPLLDLTLSDPRVVTSGLTGALFLDARSKSLATGQFEDFDDVEFATLDLSGAGVVPSGEEIAIAPVAAALTTDGAAAFAGFYPAGTVLDPLALTVSTAVDEPDPVPVPQPSPLPSPQPQPGLGSLPAPARVTALAGLRGYSRTRTVAVARVACRVGTCSLGLPKRVAFRVDGRRQVAAVLAPERLTDGQRGTVRLKLRRRALAALVAGPATAAVPIAVESGDRTMLRVIELDLGRTGSRGH